MKGIWNKYKREFVVLIATLAMCVVFTVLNKNFLNYSNFLTVLQQMVLNGILAVGMMFTIITGGIDLSVGCTYAITGIVVASCTVNYGMNPFLAILVGILIGAVLGAFNGFLINQLKLQPFIATLGTMSLYRGLAYVVTGGVPVTNVPDSYRNIFNGELVGGIRYYIIVMVVVFLVAHILLSKMRSGDYLYAVGGNEEAAAAIAFVSYPLPAVASAEPKLANIIIPAIAEQTPQKMYAMYFVLTTLTPDNLAASSFPPTAYK